MTRAECAKKGWKVLGWVRDGMWSSSATNLHNFSATKDPEGLDGDLKTKMLGVHITEHNPYVHKSYLKIDSAAFYYSVAPVALSSNVQYICTVRQSENQRPYIYID